INQWQGKVRVINFWATWCPPCKREIPDLIELQASYGNQGLQIIGIALDNRAAVSEYVEESGINYPILLGDEAVEVAEKLGNDMGILPYTVIVDQLGNIAYVRYGEVQRDTLESEIKKLL
ncbi:MAG: TlpA disulfide reductase family protein, partial [Pseudomonadota bacterium]|nr:TlpA disulfide reductase family protein [Pseudomonadota bacterium]